MTIAPASVHVACLMPALLLLQPALIRAIAIERHEKSIMHTNAVESYFQASKDMSMEYLINRNMMAVKRKETENNIHVLKEVFEIIKFLGRQNLPYRGSSSNETISNFDDILINKGNFLEMVQFASKKDAILHEHLRQAI
ncbi:hypothetical protein QTP88_028997 [Uroleucon formosanum]